ncbi:MAG: type IX secretion system outer membrane channel protein PorV [Bacteroidetes bacterium]|nr:type IX secretion system outer membrane channel protein PorV [Bacteroidota bacterium]
MKRILIFLAALMLSFSLFSQEDTRVITTGVPFLQIAPDARSAGLGDQGVATSPDAFSQFWNPAKYAFMTTKQGFTASYTPYLSDLVDDIFLGSASYYNRINERSAIGVGFRIFSLGDIELVQDEFSDALIERPNELAIDVSYSLRLSDRFSMGVALRYLRSDLRISAIDPTTDSANSFAVDIAGYYQSEEKFYNNFNGRWRGGFNISNIGPKIDFGDNTREDFLPTNLRLGGGFDFIFDYDNKLSVGAEINKLLVPTPPIRERQDTNGDGEIDNNDDIVIVDGEDDDVNFLTGIFQSFGDAPDGLSEELKEITWSLSAEYLYRESFAFRAGYFNESDEKGARQFLTLGAGFKYNVVNVDFSYLISTSQVRNPLENTLRFSLTFNLGDNFYQEF